MTPAFSAKWGASGSPTHKNRPASSPTNVNREWRTILNDPRERSGLGPDRAGQLANGETRCQPGDDLGLQAADLKGEKVQARKTRLAGMADSIGRLGGC
jgi:hypothetical protein